MNKYFIIKYIWWKWLLYVFAYSICLSRTIYFLFTTYTIYYSHRVFIILHDLNHSQCAARSHYVFERKCKIKIRYKLVKLSFLYFFIIVPFAFYMYALIHIFCDTVILLIKRICHIYLMLLQKYVSIFLW